MKVLLLGNGGREHAISWKLAQSKHISKIFVAPGNGGTAGSAKIENLGHLSADPSPELLNFCQKEQIDLVVAGPEQPLVDGIQDAFKKIGIPCFGPSQKAAQLEGSKAFAKDFMRRHHIPTADYQTFTRFEDAKLYLEQNKNKRVVIKASGLAAGKGVLLPTTHTEALAGLKEMMLDKVFGQAANEVVIEEYLEGEECSILAFTDGYTIVMMPPSQDHKRLLDGDKGLNTGGMGAYAPTPLATPEFMSSVYTDVLRPTVDGMRRDGIPFVGVLYAGLMVPQQRKPRVLEYNCRFGDPETQVILPLMEDDCDLAEVFLACCEGRLDSVKVQFKQNAYAATVVAASAGYPGTYPKGKTITIGSTDAQNSMVFHAGTKLNESGELVTSGGRVLTVTGVGSSLQDALNAAYKSLAAVKFEGMQFRRDIGHRALARLSKSTLKTTYSDAGVSIDRGNQLVENIKAVVRSTRRPGADAEIGGFGGLFDLKAAGFSNDSLLVSATDGVGTKLKLAHIMGKHDTIGIDLVAMNVNDLLVQGAEPLIFLDYFACGKLQVEVTEQVVRGIANGCVQANCALVGGETAEMPGLYQDGDYDLAGFTVGAVERKNLMPRVDSVKPGDLLFGLASSGVHSNGYSLVRHLVSKHGLNYHDACPFDPSKKLGESLLTPTKIYVKELLPVIRENIIKAMAHITGGGFIDNIPRVLPESVGVELDATTWPLLPVFKWLQKLGNMDAEEISRTFNAGIGMVLIVSKEDENQLRSLLPDAYKIGMITKRDPNQAHQVVVKNTEAWLQ